MHIIIKANEAKFTSLYYGTLLTATAGVYRNSTQGLHITVNSQI